MQQLEMIFIKFLFCKILALLLKAHKNSLFIYKNQSFCIFFLDFLSCIIPSAEYIIRPTHINTNVISIFALKYSWYTNTPSKNAIVGVIYCRIPRVLKCRIFALYEKPSSGSVVTTPPHTSRKVINESPLKIALSPVEIRYNTYITEGTEIINVSTNRPVTALAGTSFLIMPYVQKVTAKNKAIYGTFPYIIIIYITPEKAKRTDNFWYLFNATLNIMADAATFKRGVI